MWLTNSRFRVFEAPPAHEQVWSEFCKVLFAVVQTEESVSIVKLLLNFVLCIAQNLSSKH